MGLLDDLELLKKRKPNLLANVQQLQRPAEPYLRQQYPEVYGGLGGLLGMAPDEMAGSILDPNTARVRAGAEYGFPIGTATQVLPALGQLAPAVKAGARALGPTAVSMGEGYLKRRGLMPELDVYHGSPHKYDKFDASKIGTGEGAQAYGHGIYTAEAKDVGREYAKNLANRDVTNQNRLNAHANAQRLAAVTGDPSYAADDIKFVLGNEPDHPQKQLLLETLKHLESGTYKTPLENSGYLYKVDLPDEQIAKMLDWDKPFSEQAPNVQAALKSIVESEYTPKLAQSLNVLSKNPLSHSLGTLNDQLGGQHITATYLQQAGIPGIKYLDEGSRGGGKGTRNFVTFPGEEQSMTILERNGQPMIARPQQQDAAPDLLQYQQMLDEEERKKLGGLLFR